MEAPLDSPEELSEPPNLLGVRNLDRLDHWFPARSGMDLRLQPGFSGTHVQSMSMTKPRVLRTQYSLRTAELTQ